MAFTMVMTNRTATPIRNPFFTPLVTATAGQSDRARRNTGFSPKMPFLNMVPVIDLSAAHFFTPCGRRS